MKVSIGQVYSNTVDEKYEVIGYNNCYNVTIKFLKSGNIKTVQADACRKGKVSDTNYLRDTTIKRLKNLIGKVFTSLEVVGCCDSGKKLLKCGCTCGKLCIISESGPLSGHNKSCGCMSQRKAKYNIYKMYPNEFKSYSAMLRRCKYYNQVSHKSYWDKGISAQESWLLRGVEGFKNFINDVGVKPSKDCELDRVDNDLGYTKDNCRWVTKKVNLSNRSCTVKVMIKGMSTPLQALITFSGVSLSTIRDRYNSGLPFIFVFYKGDLRENKDYKIFKKATGCSVKRLSKNLGFDVLVDTDLAKRYEKTLQEDFNIHLKNVYNIDTDLVSEKEVVTVVKTFKYQQEK